MGQSRLSRRAVLKTAALGSAAAITAPYVSGAYAAGSLSLGCWDHWVPGANKTLDKICKEWGEIITEYGPLIQPGSKSCRLMVIYR